MCEIFHCMPSQLRGEDPEELNAVKTYLMLKKSKTPTLGKLFGA